MTRARYVALVIALSASTACSGGGGTDAPPVMQPTLPPTNPQNGTVTISLAQTGTTTLPSTNGITGTITLSGNNAPPGSNLTIGVSTKSPSGAPSIPAASASAFEYVSLTPSADVTFNGFPKIAMTLPAAPKSQGQFYVWMYDSASRAWTNVGAVTVTGSSLTFGGGSSSVTLKGGVTYVATPFTAKPNIICPTPPPPTPTPPPTPAPTCQAPPTPAPGPTPPGAKIFELDHSNVFGTECNTINVYDENGNQLGTHGKFPNLNIPNSSPQALTFDPINQHLYVLVGASPPSIIVYDENGHQILTTGGFPTSEILHFSRIAFASTNQQLYVTEEDTTDFPQLPNVFVYDQDGHAITTSGNFPSNLGSQTGITFDALNQQLYVVGEGKGVRGGGAAYDTNGHSIGITGTFPNLDLPSGIAFDSSNQRLYVSNDNLVVSNGTQLGNVTVYDQSGNQVTTTGAFQARARAASAIAADALNHRIYVTSSNRITVFDEDGNQISTSGTFPNVIEPKDIVVVP